MLHISFPKIKSQTKTFYFSEKFVIFKKNEKNQKERKGTKKRYFFAKKERSIFQLFS
jgi:hypothetical protein